MERRALQLQLMLQQWEQTRNRAKSEIRRMEKELKELRDRPKPKRPAAKTGKAAGAEGPVRAQPRTHFCTAST
jgi:hypothetical protein